MLRLSAGLMVLSLGLPADLSAQPRVSRAQLSSVDAASGLAPSVERIAARGEPAWIAWTLPTDTSRSSCCWSNGCEGCWLEGQTPALVPPATAPGGLTTASRAPIALEGDTELVILVRVASGRIDRVRTVGASCPLDAGGLPFYSMTNVAASQSLAWLEDQARRPPAPSAKDHTSNAAVHAIAMHRGAEADAALDRLLTVGGHVRRQVVTWLGMARGAAGLARLERLLRDDAEPDDRRRIVTAIGMSREPRARTVLIELARRHDDARVRAEALVAVARLAGRDTAAMLSEALERDPDTEVKQKAVFGLSRLPADEGVPLLIKVARDHANPAVRRTAMFWLGQSKDPRAVDFFAAILK